MPVVALLVGTYTGTLGHVEGRGSTPYPATRPATWSSTPTATGSSCSARSATPSSRRAGTGTGRRTGIAPGPTVIARRTVTDRVGMTPATAVAAALGRPPSAGT